MNEKEFKKLGRTELLELLIAQTKENQALQEEIESLKAQAQELQSQLDSRKLMIENAGSLAEACLQINGIFDAAQKASEEYLENIRLRCSEQESYARRAEAETQAKVDEMLRDVQQRCTLLETTTKRKCEEMTAKARQESQNYWDQVSSKLDAYIKQRSDLKELLASGYRKL